MGRVYHSRRYLWIDVTIQMIFTGGYDYLEHIYEWVYLFRIMLWVSVGQCDCSNHIYGWVYLSKRYSWIGATVQKTFTGGCDYLEHINGCASFQTTCIMGVCGCDCLRYIDGQVCLFRIPLWMWVGCCDCSKHIYVLVYFFRIHLWVSLGVCDCSNQIYVVGVAVQSLFMGGCDWVWLDE